MQSQTGNKNGKIKMVKREKIKKDVRQDACLFIGKYKDVQRT
ncbi:hypothetical protein HMPREF1144_6378 [Klebsiella sp. OBRC7]|nr:hypothetical protein HMPREF1144_6378 [Klebsiella sp. OBRC7]